ncbi:MAG: ATP-binding cassette domain-containing protein, partial [Selenomonadaceae bacterium]|nr:ATP-binding cassette domain-containing protein [Selenomonadaceae bacterium]
MITTNNLELQFGKRVLYKNVNLKFTPGNCYGIIGANGAGKSTFLKLLSGELEPTKGTVEITPGERLAVLKQDHYAFEETEVLRTVIMGHTRLVEIMDEKDALYAKENFSDEDGMKASELEAEFADLNGWDAETEAARLLNGLGITEDKHNLLMKELDATEKVRVLLAQALFGSPDILLLDEPTNHLDIASIKWLENFLADFPNTVIVVSHDRHFLNQVCTYICDVDFGAISLYAGNYDFWYQSSQLALQMAKDANKKKEEKIKELQNFISRFAANAAKSKQATSRKKMLEKITLDDIKPSTRKYPYIAFTPDREAGDQLLTVENISKTVDGEKVLNNVSFTLRKGDKVAFVGSNSIGKTTLFKILIGEEEADEGTFSWGVTTTQSYLPTDNSSYFDGVKMNLVDWLRQYSRDPDETFVRGFLGRMLFSGEESQKEAEVLSGGERVRCMLSKMML